MCLCIKGYFLFAKQKKNFRIMCHRSLKQCEYRPKAVVIRGFWTIIASC